MDAWNKLARVGGLLLCALAAAPAFAGWDVQEIKLNPGWNAVYLNVQPEDNRCETVFAGLPVNSVWFWNEEFTPVQFLRDPSELTPEQPGWLTYFSERSRRGFLSSLFVVHGGHSYLIELAGENPITVQLRGKLVVRAHAWVPDSFNLVGAEVNPASPPTVKQYFDADASTVGQPVYRLASNGKWVKTADPGNSPMRRGEAYWVYSKGTADFDGPLSVGFEARGGLDFANILPEQRLHLKNASSVARQVTLRMLPSAAPDAGAVKSGNGTLAGDVPLSYLRLLLWEPFEAPVSFTLPAKSEQDVLLSVRWADMAPAKSAASQYASILEVSDDGGMLYRVPVSASKSLDSTGLWVGNVTLSKVSEAGNPEHPDVPTPAASEFNFRLIVHMDSTGQARLLPEVLVMQVDPAKSGVTAAKTDEAIDFTQFLDQNESRYVLLTDHSLIPSFGGVHVVDGKIVGRRISSPVFGFRDPLPMAGKLTTTLTATVMMGYDDPLNPFVHRYHPDHNNLNERYTDVLPPGYESYNFSRVLTLEFTSEHPSGVNPPGWGVDSVGGNYRERVTGVHKKIIWTEGTFELKRISHAGKLNDGM